VACALAYIGSAAGEAALGEVADRTATELVDVSRVVGSTEQTPPIVISEKDEQLLTIAIASAPDCRVGFPCTVDLDVKAREGWHTNDAAPWKLKLLPQSGVTIMKNDRARVDKTSASMRLVIVAARAGSVRLKGTLKAYVCSEDLCKGPIAHEVDVLVPIGA